MLTIARLTTGRRFAIRADRVASFDGSGATMRVSASKGTSSGSGKRKALILYCSTSQQGPRAGQRTAGDESHQRVGTAGRTSTLRQMIGYLANKPA